MLASQRDQLSNAATTLTLSGAISGAGNLQFLGEGTTKITGTVTNTGQFHIGTLAAGNAAIVSITDGAQLGSGAGSGVTGYLAVQGGGTLRYTGTTATTTTNARSFYTNSGVGNFDITQSSGELTILATGGSNANTGSLVKSGAGTLTLSTTSRTFNQAISITGGVLGFVINNASDIVSFGTSSSVTGAAGTTLRVSGPGTLRNATLRRCLHKQPFQP